MVPLIVICNTCDRVLYEQEPGYLATHLAEHGADAVARIVPYESLLTLYQQVDGDEQAFRESRVLIYTGFDWVWPEKVADVALPIIRKYQAMR